MNYRSLMRMMVVVLLSVILVSACSKEAQQAARPSLTTIKAYSERIVPVTRPVVYATSGVVTSDHRVAVGSRLSGYIREITVREGETIKKGQLLFRVDPVDARQAFEQAQADLKDAESDLNRYQGLLVEHAVSQQQFDKIKLRYTVAKSRLAQARNQLQYAEVKSPVNGVVVEKRASVGDLASPGSPILLIEDPTSLLVETHISEQYIAHLHEGGMVRLYLPAAGRNIDGRIRQIVTAADPLTHQFLVKIAIETDAGIFPGMFVEVRFAVGSRSTLLVPVEAIVHRAGLDGIYVLDKQQVAHYRQIRTGTQEKEKIEVLAGLNAGDIVVWRKDGKLVTGIRVAPE